ncbi:MAG TPA: RDD family protein [Longimicrobium sp.]|nr:RDD family protein [Longimicrobium sp.]
MQPQERAGTPEMSCPRCGRVLPLAQPHAAAPNPYAGAWPAAAETYAPGQPYAGQPYAPGAHPPSPYGQPAYGQYSYAAMPQHYAQRYDVGIAARRWLATVLDHLLMMLGVIPAIVLPEALMPVALMLWAGMALAYFPWLEGTYGATPGKRAAGLRVVDARGNPPGLAKASIRTALRLLEVNPMLIGGIPAFICVMATRNRQRLGDLAADTFVLLREDADAVLRARGATAGAMPYAGIPM